VPLDHSQLLFLRLLRFFCGQPSLFQVYVVRCVVLLRFCAAMKRLLVCLLSLCPWLFASAKPNIIVVVADDLGYADVQFNPQHPKEINTPHLDSLAKQGIICRQGYVTGHVCPPTRKRHSRRVMW